MSSVTSTSMADDEDIVPATTRSPIPGIEPGAVIAGRYEIVRLLGDGGMGAVYEARHLALQRPVAMKFIYPELARDAALVQRFLKEARTASQVRHRNVVEVLDFGGDSARVFLVMERLQGESLQALMDREGPLAPARAIALVDPVLGALAYIHERGFVHRDVKPDNVFLALDPGETAPRPVLLDFGIARCVDENDARLTATGAAIGTPAYMSPEQARGERALTAATDQYAAAAMVYEMLSGRLPHTFETYNAAIIARATEPAVPLERWCPDLDPGLVRVVMRGLEIDAGRRFASVSELRAALAPFAHDGRVSAVLPVVGDLATGATMPGAFRTPPDAFELATPDAEAPAPTASAPSPEPAPAPVPARRGRAWLAVGALALLVAGGGAAAVRASSQGAQPAARPAVVPARPVAPEPVIFTFDFEPRAAAITLDGESLGLQHASVSRPRDGARHQLVVSAPGYAPYTEVIVADGNARIARSLVPLPAPTPVASADVTPVVTPTPTPRPATRVRSGHRRRRPSDQIDRQYPGGG